VEVFADELEAVLQASGAAAPPTPAEQSKGAGGGLFGRMRSMFKGKE
jgi:hypothetical protein